MPKELAVGDQPSEPIAADPRNPSSGRMLWIGKTYPTTKTSPTCVDRERASFGSGKGRGLDL